MLRTGFVFDEPLRTPTYSTKFHTQAYRSGHNEAVLKTVRGNSHGGSNPSACANKNGLLLAGRPFLLPQSEGTNPKGSHTAGTQHTMRHRVFAVSASRGDIGFDQYFAEQLAQSRPEQHTPLQERILTPLCDSPSRRMGYCRSRYCLR